MNIRIFFLTTLITCTFFLAQAQDVVVKAGDVQANVAIGLVPTYVADATDNIVPPVINDEVLITKGCTTFS